MKDKNGVLHSRIRPTLREGSVVTDTRTNVHWLVTEYGMVNLKGASVWERAERIISIAKSFGIDAQVIGRVEDAPANRLTIQSELGTFEY